jgi:hypothetical protein
LVEETELIWLVAETELIWLAEVVDLVWQPVRATRLLAIRISEMVVVVFIGS